LTIEREDIERLLSQRPGGARSAMQAVRDAYSEISLMRERGASWGEVTDALARAGIVSRELKAFPAPTLRSAFFLVGAELRQSENDWTARAEPAAGEPGSPAEDRPSTADENEDETGDDLPSEDAVLVEAPEPPAAPPPHSTTPETPPPRAGNWTPARAMAWDWTQRCPPSSPRQE